MWDWNALPKKVGIYKKNEPIKVLNEIENWRQIVDIDGEEGWVHSSVLSKKRFIIKSNSSSLHSNPRNPDKTVITQIDKNSRCALVECKHRWCKLECKAINTVRGWIRTSFLWGLYWWITVTYSLQELYLFVISL